MTTPLLFILSFSRDKKMDTGKDLEQIDYRRSNIWPDDHSFTNASNISKEFFERL